MPDFSNSDASMDNNNNRSATFPQGCFDMVRIPDNPQLRAWDAADEYLLQELDTRQLPRQQQSVLIINDNFGVLSVALSSHKCNEWTDSWLSRLACDKNHHINKTGLITRNMNQSIDFPDQIFDIVLLKLPKNMDLLEYQLLKLRKNMTRETLFIAADMARHIHH